MVYSSWRSLYLLVHSSWRLTVTSNLVFSEWEKVFANPMATAAAIDRIVHHSAILEFDLPSYRTNAAQNRLTEEESDRQK